MTASAATAAKVAVPSRRRHLRPQRLALYAFLTLMAVTWLFPLLWAVLTAFRPYATTINGYITWPSVLTSLSA